ncbi:MAG: hypothetical protein ABUS79_21700 [Pseudomonadota bacterium]
MPKTTTTKTAATTSGDGLPAAATAGPLLRAASGASLAAGVVTFAGVTCRRGDLLSSPVSGVPCVHWRLRITEQLNNTLQLVHEIASPEDFDLAWLGTGTRTSPAGADALRIRVASPSARIQATPVLHRPGSPGAIATARQFGFAGQLSVEEVALREGEEIMAEGVIDEPVSGAAGPFRGVEREIELLGATVRLPARAALAPVLLPWALGTAAAILGGVGVAGWVAWHFELLPRRHQGVTAPAAEIGPVRVGRRHFSLPE